MARYGARAPVAESRLRYHAERAAIERVSDARDGPCVGADIGGLYGRNGSSGNWTRYGPLDGLRATQILNVRFKSSNPAQVLCGTGNGVYYSNNSGQSWSEANVSDGTTSTATYGKDVPAVGIGRGTDSTFALIGWNDGGTIKLASTSYTSGGGPSFSQLSPLTAIPADTTSGTNKWRRTPIKIVFDQTTTGSSRTYFMLMGVGLTADRSKPNDRTLKEIWYTTDNGAHFSPIVNIGSSRVYPVDIAVSSTGSKLLITTTTTDEINSNDHDDLRGNVASCVIGTWTWTVHTLSDGACTSCSSPSIPQAYPTGACWWDGADAYVLNVQRDACTSTCSTSGDSCSAGLWKSANSGSWARIDDGRGNKAGTTTWDKGWTTCNRARGRTIDNCALSVSGKGEHWVTSQFVWFYDTSKKYANVFTSGETSPWTTKRIDNANPATIELDGGSPPAPWVGYYDIGLWKLTSTGWENKNSDGQSGRPDWGWGSSTGGYGGNVNGIVFDGSNIYVTAAPSSKSNEWRLCRSQSGGASNSWAYVGSGLTTSGTVFLNSLIKGPGVDAKWWVTLSGRLWSATDPTGTWSAMGGGGSALPDTGIMVVASNGATVLAGGWSGVFRSTDNGASWSAVSSITKPVPNCPKSDPALGSSLQGTPTKLHRRLWHGAQQILYDPDTPSWYVVLYAPSGGLDSGSKGVWRSTDDGASFSALADSVQRRGVAVDSCGQRVHISSGAPFSGGVNNDDAISKATGKQSCRLCEGGLVCVPAVAVGSSERDPLFGYLAGHALRTYDDGLCGSTSTTVYMAVPGYGLLWHAIASAPASSPCETQFRGGGDEMSARHAVGEAGPPAIPRNVFKLAEARGRIFFDLSGRRVRVQRSGVYFDLVIKDRKVVSRRTVLVTP